jgi:cholesterol transport system auxiliary component
MNFIQKLHCALTAGSARDRAIYQALRRAATAALMVLGTALLAACSASLLPKPTPPSARYTLDVVAPISAQPSAVKAAAAGAPVLTVEVPRAAPGYDTIQMMYLLQPPQLQAFAYHEWVAPPAQMLTPILVQAIAHSGGFRAVLTAPSSAPSHWRLESQLLHLQQDFTQSPSRVEVALRAVMFDGSTHQALAWREFSVSVVSAGDDPVSGAIAAQKAAQELAAAVAVFCAEQVQ